MVCTSQKIRSHYLEGSICCKISFHNTGNCFLWQENQRKWFPLAGKCFSFKIGFPNFNNGFQHQKKALNKIILFPMGRKEVSTSRNEEFV